MLEENVERNEATKQEKSSDQPRVSCFVCKREVEQGAAIQMDHPRENRVWVCREHVK